MNSIPVLGVPTYHRTDLLFRLLATLEHAGAAIEHLVIVNNHPKRNLLLTRPPAHAPVKQMTIIHHPNAGVAGAWNEIIKLFPAPWWLIVNDDIAFQPGDLAKMAGAVNGVVGWFGTEQIPTGGREGLGTGVEPVPTGAQVKPGVFYGNHGASCFGITAGCVARVGLFDENIYPAYLEDCDHAYRCDLLGMPRTNVAGLQARHGDDQLTGSCTINSDPAIQVENVRTHGNNFEYYRRKWGGINGEEKFKTPFNDPGWPVWAWRFEPALRSQQQWKV